MILPRKELMDTNGRLIQQIQVPYINKTIDVTDLPSGLYWLVHEDQTVRFVKE